MMTALRTIRASKSKFLCQVCPFQKARPSDTQLFEKSKGQPFETFARAQENKQSQRYSEFCLEPGWVMDRDSQLFTIVHKRVYEQTDLIGFFDPDGYGMPGCPMFHRSARIDQPADRPVKPYRVENSANSSAALTTRHGRNHHSSGIFTFFSFEEGSNFVQNIRPLIGEASLLSVSWLFSL
ncbi:MAG: hypothetical protein KAR19_20365 [Bacteroidales bacterium]|nr:hypothetical protein [Bacteroidales bacterium]